MEFLLCFMVSGMLGDQSGLLPADRQRKPVPISMAEAVIEPFWDPQLSGFEKWVIEPGTDCGLQIKQNWAAVDFEWASKPRSGPALRMTRDFNVDCTGYNRLIVRLTLSGKTIFRIIADTDRGRRMLTSSNSSGGKVEYALDLQGAKRIDTITLEIEPEEDGNAAGWLRWIGLQNTEMLKQYFSRWDYSDISWDAYIKDDGYVPEFEPVYGIFMTHDELEELRAKHRNSLMEHEESEYASLAKLALSFQPERGIHEFVDSGGSTKGHARVRDEYQPRLQGGTKYAIAGLVAKDAEALRMAVRYALSLAMSEHWNTGFMSSVPGSSWEDRAFRRSYAAQDIAVILDLAGGIITDAGRIYLMRRLAEEGIGPINYVMWRHEYVFHCNQFAYFNTGRMCAYLVLEREWPRAKPYADLAYREALDNLETVIEPDGGYLEGPSYFGPTIRENYKALKYYARARGKEISAVIPDVLKSTADFAAAVISTTKDDVIAICDADPSFRGDSLAILTELMPESYWVTLRDKQRALSGDAPLPRQGPPLPAFIALPHTGHIASVRELDGHIVKIFVMGHKAGADHTHEDKGSFVLEFAGQAFAMDLGICDYDDPIHAAYKHCQRHNMLAPVGMSERAHPQRPLPVDVRPVGSGDEKSFHASIDATPGWEGYYRKWVRTWDSPSPDRLVIHDDYDLARGDGVEFYWQTNLPVEQRDQTVVVTGDSGTATLTIPEDCTVCIDSLPLFGGGQHKRIAIRKTAIRGVLEVVVKLHCNSESPASEAGR